MISAPEHLSRAFHEVLDDPRHWTPGMPRPLFDSESYQKRIDAITDGKRILRLSWAPEILGWNPRPIDSTPAVERVPEHAAISDARGNPIAPPRWMIEERLESESYFDAWEANRYFNDPRDRKLYDLRGPAPREGLWRWVETINAHDSMCCALRLRGMVVCWGYYKEPGEKELRSIREKWSQIQRDKEVNPFAKPEHLTEGQAERDLASRMREEQQAQREGMTTFWLDKLKTRKLDMPTLHGFLTQGLMKTNQTMDIQSLHNTIAREAEDRRRQIQQGLIEEPT